MLLVAVFTAVTVGVPNGKAVTMYIKPPWAGGPGGPGNGDEEELPTIDLLGMAWNLYEDRIIDVLIIPNPSLSDWEPSFVLDAQNAIAEWANAIDDSIANQGGPEYLNLLNVDVKDLDDEEITYDVTIEWVTMFAPPSIIGATTIEDSDGDGDIDSAQIILAIRLRRKYQLTDIDMQNVVAHEFGHVLALGHASNAPKDELMNPSTSLPQDIRPPSNLDAKGLTVIYDYLTTPAFSRPTEASVSLESDEEWIALN